MKRKKNKKKFKTDLGYSPVQKTASGAGYHGRSGRAQRKAERKEIKEQLKGRIDENG